MSSNSEEFPAIHSPWGGEAAKNGPVSGRPFPSRREWAISLLLFIVTSLSISLAGLFYVSGVFGFKDAVLLTISRPGLILYGIQYSAPLIAILLAHEMGHFLACRYYGIRCTPPYFIPVPVSFTGTLGAFIKIKAPFGNKRALFDVGIAGPLAGFIVTLPILWIGISLSRIVPKGTAEYGFISFGEPLIFRLIGMAALNYDSAAQDLLAHPVTMAGWFGLLVTSLNLLPVWQLDGGHITYAVFGPKHHKKISVTVLAMLMLVGLLGWPMISYLVFGLLVSIMGYRHRFYHPATLRDWEPLGPARMGLALVALIILVLCFIPIPVSFT